MDIEELKKITIYNNFTESHPAAKRFWRVLETFNQEQLSAYLIYVYGRSRLGHNLTDTHKLSYCKTLKGIPESHTCFFELDLGEYPSDEDLNRKLLYGIENCKEIAETSGTYNLSADFAL